jgi:(1->4)-alpha-D-glucan 1-alpha-D-glucosylmutase
MTQPHLSRPRPLGRVPVSSYRLQLHTGMTFAQARDLLPYLHQLGITELYLSPSFRAGPGSTHGYDICDHSQLSPELGGEEGFASLAEAARALDMGLLLDFVPNHMGTDPMANRWWRDVLENGPSSAYAHFFDIDWRPLKKELNGKVLLPVLSDQYGRVLERGELQVRYENGGFDVLYQGLRFPLNPRHLSAILEPGTERLKAERSAEDPEVREYLSIITAHQNLPECTTSDPARIEERHREKEIARERLARLCAVSTNIRELVADNVRAFNGTPGEAASFDPLHQLLEQQNYRLAYWRTAQHEINYRRFFDINDLVGVRVEDPQVFAAIHEGVLRLARAGWITGLRLDHIDGLLDPQGYLQHLDEVIQREVGHALYTVAEKILSGSEALPESFVLEGTSGYDFLNDLNGLFVRGRGALPLKRLYARLDGPSVSFADVVYRAKSLIASSSLASELSVLAQALNRLSEEDRRSRDFTLISLRAALREIVACFPTYRTYLGPGGAAESDAAVIESAVAQARRRNPAMESSVFEFLRGILLSHGPEESAETPSARRAFALKLQQYTGPLQAKGLEDTAFYRYPVLLSLNEVGGDPQRFGVTPRAFHAANQHRAAHWPLGMLATSTHDSKRGEDARCRIDVLSEIPIEWGRLVLRWRRNNASARSNVEGEPAPDGNDEYFFYQSLLGAWPAEQLGWAAPSIDFRHRISEAMQKAMREAKLHTSWINNNEAYERACLHFVETVLDPETGQTFLASFVPFCARVAFYGMLNSLSQLVLKLASPGVADFYQGSEEWNLSLVDPDTRRPVSFSSLSERLHALEPYLDGHITDEERRAFLAELMRAWPDGRIKTTLTCAGLRARRQHHTTFLQGEYLPLESEGELADHVVALARTGQDGLVVAVAPRLCTNLASENRLPLGAEVWRDTLVRLPAGESGAGLVDVFTGRTCPVRSDAQGAGLALADVLTEMSVALLVRTP